MANATPSPSRGALVGLLPPCGARRRRPRCDGGVIGAARGCHPRVEIRLQRLRLFDQLLQSAREYDEIISEGHARASLVQCVAGEAERYVTTHTLDAPTCARILGPGVYSQGFRSPLIADRHLRKNRYVAMRFDCNSRSMASTNTFGRHGFAITSSKPSVSMC